MKRWNPKPLLDAACEEYYAELLRISERLATGAPAAGLSGGDLLGNTLKYVCERAHVLLDDTKTPRDVYSLISNLLKKRLIDAIRKQDRERTLLMEWGERRKARGLDLEPDPTILFANDEDRQVRFARLIQQGLPVLLESDYFHATCFVLRQQYVADYRNISIYFEIVLRGSGDPDTVATMIRSLAAREPIQPSEPIRKLMAALEPTPEDLARHREAFKRDGSAYWDTSDKPFGLLSNWAHQQEGKLYRNLRGTES